LELILPLSLRGDSAIIRPRSEHPISHCGHIIMSLLINAYCTVTVPPAPQFPHGPINHRDRTDPGLMPHLNGFMNYIMSKGGDEMSTTVYELLRHLERVQHQFSITIAEDALEDFAEWAWQANAICFMPDGTVRDPSGSILVDPEGAAPDPEADVPYPDDARVRRERMVNEIEKLGITVPSSLPPVVSESEIVLRSPADVAARMQALLLVAVRAESVSAGDLLPVHELRERLSIGYQALTPNELQFVQNDSPDEQTTAQFVWRYEAMCVLHWSLGLIDELPYPDSICDVGHVAELALESNSVQFLKTCKLRPISEVLDALDFTYRLHWASRNARIKNEPQPANLNQGVVMERHYALNWLTRYQDADWDKVDTPT